MKLKLVIAIFVTLIFVGFSSAQTIKTDEARQLKRLEKQISYYEGLLDSAKDRLSRMNSDVSSTYTEADKNNVKEQISSLEKNLGTYYQERKTLLTKEMTRTLPNTQIELLKLIILQNEKIIDLLEEKKN
ncbi:MAG TPA: hypothetical protein PKY82_01990 [Pyrinomonadaceae bacterium]|nr:hypothetical protein [Pyrinomonadaceae bacterium]